MTNLKGHTLLQKSEHDPHGAISTSDCLPEESSAQLVEQIEKTVKDDSLEGSSIGELYDSSRSGVSGKAPGDVLDQKSCSTPERQTSSCAAQEPRNCDEMVEAATAEMIKPVDSPGIPQGSALGAGGLATVEGMNDPRCSRAIDDMIPLQDQDPTKMTLQAEQESQPGAETESASLTCSRSSVAESHGIQSSLAKAGGQRSPKRALEDDAGVEETVRKAKKCNAALIYPDSEWDRQASPASTVTEHNKILASTNPARISTPADGVCTSNTNKDSDELTGAVEHHQHEVRGPQGLPSDHETKGVSNIQCHGTSGILDNNRRESASQAEPDSPIIPPYTSVAALCVGPVNPHATQPREQSQRDNTDHVLPMATVCQGAGVPSPASQLPDTGVTQPVPGDSQPSLPLPHSEPKRRKRWVPVMNILSRVGQQNLPLSPARQIYCRCSRCETVPATRPDISKCYSHGSVILSTATRLLI